MYNNLTMAKRRTIRRRSSYSDGVSGAFNALIWVGLLVALGFGIYLGIPMLREHIEGIDSEPSAKTPKKTGTGHGPPAFVRPPSGSPAGAPSLSPQAAPPRNPHVDLHVAIMAKESERYGGDPVAEARHRDEAVQALARLRGQKEADRLDPDDQIQSLDDIDLTRMAPGDASVHLKKMMLQIPKGTFLKFSILRGPVQKEVYTYFPPGSSLAGVNTDTGRVQISNALAGEIQRDVLTLPPAYLPDGERQDIVRILGKGEATPEEFALITRRVQRLNGGGPSVAQQDKETFARKVAELGGKLATTPIPDVVITKDGRQLSGTLLEDSPSGAAILETGIGRIPVPRDEIRFFHLSADLRQEFQNKLATAQTELHPAAWPALLRWTQQWNMPVHREYLAYVLLQRDPADAAARMAAGFYHTADGKWISGPKSREARKPETRAEVQAELESMGFILKNGKWFSKANWTAAIDTLHRSLPLKMTLDGVVLQSWNEKDTPLSRLDDPAGKPKTGPDANLRFLTPQGASGTVHIAVEAPGEIEECQVKAIGMTLGIRQGKLEVYVTPEGGAQPHLLYLVEDSANTAVHDVTLPLRGKRKFTVSARMTNTMDRFHAYARFLSSLPGSQEIFVVSARILAPAPAEIDRIWLSAK